MWKIERPTKLSPQPAHSGYLPLEHRSSPAGFVIIQRPYKNDVVQTFFRVFESADEDDMADPKPTTGGTDWRREEYVALRAEIIQSIAKQHQILLSGYGLAATLTGFFIKDNGAALAAVPFALVAMAALWTVECNRMVRASYYIAAHLWPESHGWETWIRELRGDASDFRENQHWLQMIVTVFVPLGATLCVGGAASPAIMASVPSHLSVPIVVVYWVLICAFWLALARPIRRVSNLAAILPDRKP